MSEATPSRPPANVHGWPPVFLPLSPRGGAGPNSKSLETRSEGNVTSISKNVGGGLSRRSALTLGAAAASALALGAAPVEAAKRAGGVKITVLYGAPKSPDDFEKYYAEHHMPMVYKVKGIRRIELAKGLATPGAATPAYYRVTERWFSSMKKMEADDLDPGVEGDRRRRPEFRYRRRHHRGVRDRVMLRQRGGGA